MQLVISGYISVNTFQGEYNPGNGFLLWVVFNIATSLYYIIKTAPKFFIKRKVSGVYLIFYASKFMSIDA